MRLLKRLDWFGAMALLPISDPRTQTVAPHLAREQLMEAIHCVTGGGKIHRGARCLRFLGMRLPLLVPVALVLWIPGAIQVAEMVYRWVSRRRLCLSSVFGCKGVCAVLPERHCSKKERSG